MSQNVITMYALACIFVGLSVALVYLRIKSARSRSPGEKAAFGTLSFAVSLNLFGSFAGLYVLYFATRERDWQLAVLMAVFALVSSYHFQLRGLAKLFGRTIRLQRLNMSDAVVGPSLRIGHLSDLHLTSGTTLEGDIDAQTTYNAALAALKWALPRCDLVVLTGDLTDRGSEPEWVSFGRVLGNFSELERQRILFIPGNHDLCLSEDSVFPGVDRDFEKRSHNLIRFCLGAAPRNWMVVGGIAWRRCFATYRNASLVVLDPSTNKYVKSPDEAADEAAKDTFAKALGGTSAAPVLGISLQTYLYAVKDFAAMYLANPPTYKIGPEMAKVKVGYFVWDEKLLEAARKFGETWGFPWPTKERHSMAELVDALFPILMFENEQFFCVGLNSNTVSSDNIFTGALGKVGSDQLERLSQLIAARRGKCLVLLVHHHIGFPIDSIDAIRAKFGKLHMAALRLRDARKLAKVISAASACVLFHGHKHMLYRARLGSTTVISGSSVLYGDVLTGVETQSQGISKGSINGCIYTIGMDGTIRLDDQCNCIDSCPAASEEGPKD